MRLSDCFSCFPCFQGYKPTPEKKDELAGDVELTSPTHRRDSDATHPDPSRTESSKPLPESTRLDPVLALRMRTQGGKMIKAEEPEDWEKV